MKTIKILLIVLPYPSANKAYNYGTRRISHVRKIGSESRLSHDTAHLEQIGLRGPTVTALRC